MKQTQKHKGEKMLASFLSTYLPYWAVVTLQALVVIGAIFWGAKLGGIGIGYAGGIGVVILALGFGLKSGAIPIDVILIIASVISAISAMQVAGGMDYLVDLAERILRKNPKYINYLAPITTYVLTFIAGTGHTAFSMMPVIVDVAKSANIKPSAPLSISVVASQIAITASPISAAVVYMTGVLEPFGISYITLLGIWISTTFAGCMLTAFIVSTFSSLDLSKDKTYQERLAQGLVSKPKNQSERNISQEAKRSVWIFISGVICIVLYAIAVTDDVAWIKNPALSKSNAIISFMLVISVLIASFCKIKIDSVANSSVFKSGMVACICVLGVAWLGNTFVEAHVDEIKHLAADVLRKYPYFLALGLAVASTLLYSQSVTAKTLMPAVIAALGISAGHTENAYIVVASFAAVSALFVLPTYPTLLGAVQMDDTGSTKIGKYVFNHSFMIPGLLAIALSVALGFVLAPMML